MLADMFHQTAVMKDIQYFPGKGLEGQLCSGIEVTDKPALKIHFQPVAFMNLRSVALNAGEPGVDGIAVKQHAERLRKHGADSYSPDVDAGIHPG